MNINTCMKCGKRWKLQHSCNIIAAAKSPAERKAAERQRRTEAGLMRLEIYAHPDDHEAIKEVAAKLAKKRARESAKAR